MARQLQYGDQLKADAAVARRELGPIMGPIPRYMYKGMTDETLAEEIKRRWLLRRMQMSARLILDTRLMRWFDPERVQDQWQSVWDARVLPKLHHNAGLSIMVLNWSNAVVEALTGLIAGQKPFPYVLDAVPHDASSPSAVMQADIVDKFVNHWQYDTSYALRFADGAAQIMGLGRRWNHVVFDPDTKQVHAENVNPARVAAFWQHDERTLEAATIATEMLPGEAVSLYPEKEAEIAAAITSPWAIWGTSTFRRQGNTWAVDSRVLILDSWYRSSATTIGHSAVLLNAANGNGKAIVLDRDDDTQYPDISLYCTPRFKTMDRTPDLANGVLFQLASLNTEYNEVFSAARDMLWRAIYQRYKAKGFVNRAPVLLPGTAMYAMRSDQDISRIDDVLNNAPVEQMIAHLERLMMTLPGVSEYFMGNPIKAETSQDAIVAAINASITRIATTQTEITQGELWMYRMLTRLSAKFGEVQVDGQTIPLRSVLEGGYDFALRFRDATPHDAIKAKQMALAGLRAGVLSVDTVQDEWNILSKQDEQRKIRKDRGDMVMQPGAVSQTASAMTQVIRAKQAQQQASAPPPQPSAPPPRVSVSLKGLLPPEDAAAAAIAAGVNVPQGAPAPGGGGAPSGGIDGMAKDSANVAGEMGTSASPPAFEGDNEAGGMEPNAQGAYGEQGQGG